MKLQWFSIFIFRKSINSLFAIASKFGHFLFLIRLLLFQLLFLFCATNNKNEMNFRKLNMHWRYSKCIIHTFHLLFSLFINLWWFVHRIQNRSQQIHCGWFLFSEKYRTFSISKLIKAHFIFKNTINAHIFFLNEF